MAFTVGDTAPPLAGICQQVSGGCGADPAGVITAANLVGAVVELHIDRNGMAVLTVVPTVVSAAEGKWSYDWAVGDLSVTGMYAVEAQVTYGDGRIQTFGPASFRVEPQIA